MRRGTMGWGGGLGAAGLVAALYLNGAEVGKGFGGRRAMRRAEDEPGNRRLWVICLGWLWAGNAYMG